LGGFPNPAPIDDAAWEAAQELRCCAPVEPVMLADDEAETLANDGIALEEVAQAILFKTPTCPNCKAAMALLDKAGVNYETLNANEEKELVEKYGIKQAPTLVIPNDEGFERYRGVSDIKGWIKSR
jgi:ribonucleoside-triphosphate reductase